MSQYGGVPNDGKSDREAFAKTLEAAGARRVISGTTTRFLAGNVKAIIYFPEGEWVLQEEGEQNCKLDVTMGQYVIRGAGCGKTRLCMNVANTPANLDQAWSAPTILNLTYHSGLTDKVEVTKNDLVIWNMESTSSKGNLTDGSFTFWDVKWMKILPPVIVGFHGAPLIFYQPSVKHTESLGKAVEPRSLYVAQLQ